MAAAIATAHPDAKVEKVPGSNGDFIVTADNKEVWNKLAHPERRFPDHSEILSLIGSNA